MKFPTTFRLSVVLLAMPCLCPLVVHAEPAPAPTPNVTFTVTGPDGKPVAGATVALRTIVASKAQDVMLQTDAKGQVSTFAAPGTRSYGPHLNYGSYLVRQPGLAVASGSIEPGDNAVQLQPGKSIGGAVVDANNAPVPNAMVDLSYVVIISSNSSRMIDLHRGQLASQFTTHSDAGGHWSFNDLPADATASVQLDDPRFARVDGQVTTGETQKHPLVATPGGNFAGRVVLPDGKPVAGQRISIVPNEGTVRIIIDSVTTGADGRFVVASLGTGTYDLHCPMNADLTEWVAATVKNIGAKAGETTAVPDIVLTHGGVVEGRFTDTRDQKPIPGVRISLQGPMGEYYSTISDAQGQYRLHAVPGTNHMVMGRPLGYQYAEKLSPSAESLQVAVTDGGDVPLSFALEPSLTVDGQVLDADGNPALGASVLLGADRDYGWQDEPGTAVGDDGQWQLADQVPGDYTVAVKGPWVLVSPTTVHLPSEKPISIVVAPFASAGAVGLVTTPAGQPIAGANVDIMVCSMGPCLSSKATTGPSGHYIVQSMRPQGRVTLMVSKVGYRVVSAGKASQTGNAWTITPTVMLPLDSQVRGKLRDATGAPIAGATVYCDDGDASSVATSAADGSFTLAHLPPGPVDLVAVTDSKLALGHLDAATRETTLTLAPPTAGEPVDAGDALDLIQEMAERNAAKQYAVDTLAREMARYDLRRAAIMSQHVDGSVPDYQLASLLHSAAASQNPDIKQCEAVLAKIKANPDWISAVASIGKVIATADPSAGQAIFSRLVTLLPAKAANDGDVAAYAGATRLAVALGNPNAAQGFEAGLEAARARDIPTPIQMPGIGPRALQKHLVAHYVSFAAEGQPALVQDALDKLPPEQRQEVLAMCLPGIAKTDMPTARRLFVSLSQMPPSVAPVVGNTHFFNDYFNGAVIQDIVAIGPSEPAAALALARQVDMARYKSIAIALAAGDADTQAAPALFREALGKDGGFSIDSGNLPIVAAIASRKDPALGRELFAAVQQRVDGTPEPTNQKDEFTTNMALFDAPFDPVASRIMLETMIARQRQTGSRNNLLGPASAILAMAAIDPRRSVELIRALPAGDDDRAGATAAAGLARYLNTPADERGDLHLDYNSGFSSDYYFGGFGW